MISWYVGNDDHHQQVEVGTPWSIALPDTANRTSVSKALLVVTAADDEATCRIIVDGKVTVERTSNKVAACAENLPKP